MASIQDLLRGVPDTRLLKITQAIGSKSAPVQPDKLTSTFVARKTWLLGTRHVLRGGSLIPPSLRWSH